MESRKGNCDARRLCWLGAGGLHSPALWHLSTDFQLRSRKWANEAALRQEMTPSLCPSQTRPSQKTRLEGKTSSKAEEHKCEFLIEATQPGLASSGWQYTDCATSRETKQTNKKEKKILQGRGSQKPCTVH